MPLIVGLDGVKKMSKSAGNYIAFNDPAKEMFGKIMSVDDDVMWDYYKLLLLQSDEAIEALRAGHPMEAKKQLAAALVSHFHGGEAAAFERAQFEKVFSRNQLPDDMPVLAWQDAAGDETEATSLTLAAASQLFESNGEIRRLHKQGAFKVNRERVVDPHTLIPRPAPGEAVIIQAGKRKVFKVTG